MKIGIIAPSAPVPLIELKLGVDRIKKAGFSVIVHPQCRKKHLFFAGTDSERASAFFEYAQNPEISALWCGRGGYGAVRLLPILEKYTQEKGIPPKKLLVSYSDGTALMEYVRKVWGWSTLHAPMPGLRKFSLLPDQDWDAMANWIQGKQAVSPWEKKKLTYWTAPPQVEIRAPLVGGNLTVWNSLVGTRFEAKGQDRILFLEDVDESLYRIDRVLQQLTLSQNLNGVKAIVLGNFLNCRDYSPSVLKEFPSPKSRNRVLHSPKPGELKPLRKVYPELKVLKQIFREIGEKLQIPVAYGLPVGHGPEVSPLPLGADYRLLPTGQLELLKWDWMI
jgi:muramoyltetrapeptide carboxypeptidase